MTTLIEQMEQLQKQQAILAEKIKEEKERNKKLAQDASIDRLEALIEPLTQYLDWINPTGCGRTHWESGNNKIWDESLSRRENINNNFKRKKTSDEDIIKYNHSQILVNEEIFVTLLGIIKKQDARIEELEKANNFDNTQLKRASTIEFSDLQMMKRY